VSFHIKIKEHSYINLFSSNHYIITKISLKTFIIEKFLFNNMIKKEMNNRGGNPLIKPTLLPATKGQKAADQLTKIAGSWGFIFGFGIFLLIWIAINSIWLINSSWDPYPFILLNLALSCLAALQAPIILMSQNRSNERDRQRAEYDYAVNRKSERGIEKIKRLIEKLDKKK